MRFIKTGVSLLAVSVLSASPAQNIYVQKCASCHGANGDMKAMGTSRSIKEMPVEEIEKALINYASGERKAMPFVKSVKKDFMNKYTKEEVHGLANYIHGLNK
ncbi:c-type cytochrome [Sulfurovum sp. XGS-02]|uniref:c-type cytochrome n=1 Tax=Sulfurovum sp. XGS-02 TaxID=2925411 RepID=UPI0020670440|nr:c-type cytochrome [Sulfurovum sp. XGS-02]UPT76569.1 c-type cytochrome [Sulfurovum sp. XGS-02]